MRKILLLFLITSIGINAQENIIDSLENEINKIDKEINTLNEVKGKLQSAILIEKQKQIQLEEANGFKAEVTFGGGALWTEPSLRRANSIMRLKRGDRVTVYEFVDEDFVKVKYGDIPAYMLNRSIKMEGRYKDLYIELLKSNNPALGRLVEKYGIEDGRRVHRNLVWIGMTKTMARESLGNPSETARIRFEWGLSETWYYYKGYDVYKVLHFMGNKLKSISDY